jgi:hypothetical protein
VAIISLKVLVKYKFGHGSIMGTTKCKYSEGQIPYALLGAILLVYLVFSSTMNMDAPCPSGTYVDFREQHGITTNKIMRSKLAADETLKNSKAMAHASSGSKFSATVCGVT